MPSKITRSEQWWAQAPAHVLRCTSHLKSTGARCRREAHPGATVCRQHGALAPAVQAAAATRLQMSADDAVKRLQAMLDDDDVDAREKVKILHDLLDRSGLGATSKHLVGLVANDPVEQLFQDILSDSNALQPRRAAEPVAPAPAALSAVARLDDATDWSDPQDVVDAELVPETHEVPEPVEPPPTSRPSRSRGRGARGEGRGAIVTPRPGNGDDNTASVTPRHIAEALADLL